TALPPGRASRTRSGRATRREALPARRPAGATRVRAARRAPPSSAASAARRRAEGRSSSESAARGRAPSAARRSVGHLRRPSAARWSVGNPDGSFPSAERLSAAPAVALAALPLEEVGDRTLVPRDQLRDGVEQLRTARRLLQEDLRAAAERRPLDLARLAPRQDDDRDVRRRFLRAELLEELETAPVRKPEIEDHDVGTNRDEEPAPFGHARCRECLVTAPAKLDRDPPAHGGLVLDDENPSLVVADHAATSDNGSFGAIAVPRESQRPRLVPTDRVSDLTDARRVPPPAPRRNERSSRWVPSARRIA